MRLPVDEIVAATLEAPPDEACRRLLDAVCAAAGAEQAFLLRSGKDGEPPAVRHATGGALDVAALGSAFDGEDPVRTVEGNGRRLLVLPLAVPSDVPWWLVLATPIHTPWEAGVAGALADAIPVIVLAVDHAVVRDRLREAYARQEDGERTHQQLLSVISHELRNPLAPILMWTSTLRRVRTEDPEVARATRAIDQAVGLVKRLLEDMGEMGRIERGTVALRREHADLRDAARRAIEAQRAAAEHRKLRLVDDLAAAAVPVYGDPDRLARVATNVVENAVKFAPADGTVWVRVACKSGRAVLEVRDSGGGLPEVVLSRLFTPFTQGPNARGGLGLGLAIASALTALHSGTLAWVDRPAGGGAFVLSLPLDTAAA